MSRRSTSGPATHSSMPIYQSTHITGNVPEPPSSSSRPPHSRTSSYTLSRSHSHSRSQDNTFNANSRQASFSRHPLPSFRRRDSDRSINTFRGLSQAGPGQSVAGSVVGTSTPTRRLRRGKEGGNANGHGTGKQDMKEDWAALEPDEVFRRLPVNEVKRVESKMRSEALNKQSELRSMVGTRYRDLLTSATQITTLHSSSLRLSESLKTISKTCAAPTDTLNITLDGGRDDSIESDADDVVQMLPVAAHMKLLLDAPEALYSYLHHHAFLEAAFLWLIVRVVREGLSNMPEESSGPYLPLLQKQWETLLPFRGQIVQRATASLRSREKLDPKTVSETLLSIILLDNLPLPDALALLLSQRTKALRDILAHPAEPSRARSNTTTSTRARRNSRLSTANATREAAHEREAISRGLTEAVQCLLDTVAAAQAVFDKRRKTTLDGESMLEEAMRLVQKGESAPTLSSATPAKQNSHQRRASRLVSISLPMPKLSPGAVRPPVSAPGILQTLPSSQILLRHLPPSITAWTPFITSSPPPRLDEKLESWQKASVDILAESVPGWLGGLKSVSDIWEVRSSLIKILAEGDFELAIRSALEDEWSRRVKEVWTTRLDQVVNDAENKVRQASEKIRSSGGQGNSDIAPESFLFTDLTFPSAPASAAASASALTALGPSHANTAFTAFLSQIKRRTSYRTPLLDEVLMHLESAAAEIKADMKGLPSSLYVDYTDRVGGSLRSLVQVLERVLESIKDGKEGVEAELLVGRVALYLARGSGFLADIAGQGQMDMSEIESALIQVHALSTKRWQERSIKEALTLLAPLFDPYRGPSEIRSTWQGKYPTTPSAAISESLHSLVKSTRHLGLPPNSGDLPIVPDLVKGFVGRAKGLEGWAVQEKVGEGEGGEGAAQAALDVGLLVWLAGGDPEKDEMIQRFLNLLPSALKSSFSPTLRASIEEHVRRTQLLLHPLTSHLPPFPAAAEQEPRSFGFDRHSSLLKFGQPSAAARAGGAGGASEFRSPVPVARPGKRMGLLSIAA